jgi:hypothetical protein
VTRQGVREFLDQIVSVLALTHTESDATESSQPEQQEYNPHGHSNKDIVEITDLELDYLIEQEMIDEDDATNIHVWKLDHPDTARLVWITMR